MVTLGLNCASALALAWSRVATRQHSAPGSMTAIDPLSAAPWR